MKQTKNLLIALLSLALLFSSIGVAQVQAASLKEETPPVTETDMTGGTLSSGGEHTCRILVAGTVECRGKDDFGQVSSAPAITFSQISAGRSHTCGVAEDGTAQCWGSDGSGQSTPLIDTYLHVSAGTAHTCGLTTAGTIKCWGDNFFNQVSARPTTGKYTQLSVGANHACAVRDDGQIKCWGLNDYGQAVSQNVTGAYRAVSAGGHHTCAIKTDGTIQCWGYNENGQSNTPDGNNFLRVDAGENHTCALRTTGAVLCWGDDTFKQSTEPTTGTFIEITAGDKQSCALTSGNARVCWGDNTYGQSAPPVIRGYAGGNGVQLKYQIDGVNKVATANSNGFYAIAVPYEWSGTITPLASASNVYFLGLDKVSAFNTYSNLLVNQYDQNFERHIIDRIYSAGSFDGMVAEKKEGAKVGQALNYSSLLFNIGDTSADQQVRAILSFNTSEIPDAAIIKSASVNLRLKDVLGTNPFTTHGSLLVDIMTGSFSNNAALQSSDFEAAPTKAYVGVVGSTPVSGYYQAVLNAVGRGAISKNSITQLRLRFQLADDDNLVADALRFFSGENITAKRPILIVDHYLPAPGTTDTELLDPEPLDIAQE